MTRKISGLAAAGVALVTVMVAGCGAQREDAAVAPPAADAAEVAASAPVLEAAAPATAAGSATPAAPGAPAFAILYPQATPDGPPTLAQGPSGPGGILSYTTEAAPDAVIDFHRRRAEDAGLVQINTMNQGDARAYSAGDGADGRGQLLSVVAAPTEDGRTGVQLSWSAGQ